MNESLESKYLDRSGGYRKASTVLCVIGPMVLVVGVIFMVVGLGSFFASMGSFDSPRYFWCVFVGMPLLFVGSVLTMFGFMGKVARYQANQIAPVGKDVVNYMAVGTQEGVKTTTKAMAEGLREGLAGQPLIGVAAPASAPKQATIACPKCRAANQAGSKFCDQCGKALV